VSGRRAGGEGGKEDVTGSRASLSSCVCPFSSFSSLLHRLAADPVALIDRIRAKGMKVGVALKPGTPVDAISSYVDRVDMVLVMSVEPGFGGQSFMPSVLPKVAALRASHPSLLIQIDGGIGPANIDVVAEAGANVIVAGTTIFGSSDPAGVMKTMRAAVDKAGAARG
jgi:ribulose-phosphate 3-epimerase